MADYKGCASWKIKIMKATKNAQKKKNFDSKQNN